MRRKSERNKAKGTPEKKVEKPTRRTTRRRGKASPSPSPDRETPDDNVSSTPSLGEEKTSEFQSEEQSNDNEDVERGVSSSELIKSVLGAGEEEDNGSVWKVARADASPGQIQKLKICRQRNISEASDSSLGRKKSNKWPDGGEGGMEEADSADEQVASSEIVMSNQTDDASSMHPGQDSNEEVSDHKENLPETTSANLSDDKTNIDQLAELTENVTETTAPHSSEPGYEDNQSTTNLPCHESNLDPSSHDGVNEGDLTVENSSYNQQHESQDNPDNPALFNSIVSESQQFNENTSVLNEVQIDQGVSAQESTKFNNEQMTNESERSYDDQSESCGGIDASSDQPPSSLDETRTSNIEPVISYEDDNAMEGGVFNQHTILEQKTLLSESFENAQMVSTGSNDDESSINRELSINALEEQEDGEIREELVKEPSSESDSVSNNRDASVTRDAPDSHSPSAEIDSTEKSNEHRESSSRSPEKNDERDQQYDAEKESRQDDEAEPSSIGGNIKKRRRVKRGENLQKQSESSEKHTVSSNNEPEIEMSESIGDKEDILEISEKTDDLNVTLSTSKPAKVSLKRSFSARLSTDAEANKEDKSNKSFTDSNQDKENHVVNDQPDQKGATKRRKWGTTTSNDVAPTFSISTDSLKALVPGAKPLSVNEVRLNKDEDEKERRKSRREESRERRSRDDTGPKEADSKTEDSNSENHTAPKRRITISKEAPRPTSPSLPEAQATNVLLIKNLVRPFTLNQIKELLSRTGTIVENGFWMDRIKSKCYVEYTNEDQAFETRQALHGVSWPLSNPKKLIVEYANKEDMENARESSKDQPPLKKAEPLVSNDIWHQDQWAREERPVASNKVTIIREWDLGKLGKEDGQLGVKEKEKERKEYEKKKRQRSRSPARETHLPAPARKFKKKEEEPPTAKLLDDLFRKTKSTPCIYWLPLTNEQIVVKEEMRRQHMAEHARRLEEMRRAERSRDTRRRRSPRK